MSAYYYEDIGRYLREGREDQRLSAQDVAQALHIRVHYIEALEAGDMHRLPGKAYVRGYIKNYALLLGVDPQEVLEAFDATPDESKKELFIPEPTLKESLSHKTLLGLAAGALVLLLFSVLLTHRGRQEVVLTVPEVPAFLEIQARAIRDPHMWEWKECLEIPQDICVNILLSKNVLGQLQDSQRQVIKLLMPQDTEQ